MMKNVEFATMLAILLIAAATTGTFLASPTVSEMQVREAAFGPKAMLHLADAQWAPSSVASLR